MPGTETIAPAQDGWRAAIWARTRRIADEFVLKAHRFADRADRLPSEFGKAGPVDEADPQALRREWLRCLRLWADYNPEEVFALKVGAALLGGAVIILWGLVAFLR
jgi:hypothetical protein